MSVAPAGLGRAGGAGPAGGEPVCAVVTDIEGTTTAIAFVRDVLFPFAAAALDCFLDAHRHDPEVAAALAEVERLAPGAAPAVTLRCWMARDEKAGPLKAIQGMIWRAGYRDGRLRGHLYPDVAASLRSWSRGGVRLCVYSSGSAEAQRLLFGHSEAGDLGPLFEGFLDTTVGPKREAASYRAIVAGLHLPAAEVLFLSDVAEELDAAAEAGLRTCQLVRAADGTVACGRHAAAADFPAVAAAFALPSR